MSNGNGDDSSVRITMRDVYSKLEEQRELVAALARSVEQLSGEMKGSMALMVVNTDSAREDLKDHEARIRMLERGRWPLPSLAVLVSTASLVYSLMMR